MPWVDPTPEQWGAYRRQLLTKRKGSRFKVLIEIGLLLIFPYPYLEGSIYIKQEGVFNDKEGRGHYVYICYDISELIYVLMFIRILFLLRAVFNMTPYHNDHARIHCFRRNTLANVRFSFKCMLKTHPIQMILSVVIPTFFLFGVFVRVFERPYSDVSNINFQAYLNAVWCCAVTMSTIGYGDIYPSTHLGRFVALVCAVWGAFAFSMIVFALGTRMNLSQNQHKAFREVNLSRAAIVVVVEGLRLNLLKNKYGADSIGAKRQRSVLDKVLIKHKSTLKKMQDAFTREEANEFAIKKQHRKVKMQLNRIEAKLDRLINKDEDV